MSEREKPKRATVPLKNTDVRKKEVEPRSKIKVPVQANSRVQDKSVERQQAGKTRGDKSVERPKNPGRSESLTRNKPVINTAPQPKQTSKIETKPAIKKPTQKQVPRKETAPKSTNKTKVNEPVSKHLTKTKIISGSTSQNAPKTKPSSNSLTVNKSLLNNAITSPKHNLEGKIVQSKAIPSKSQIKPSRVIESNSLLKQSSKANNTVKPPRSETASLKNGRTPIAKATENHSDTLERPRTSKVRSGGKRENGASRAEAIYIPNDLDDEVIEDLIPNQSAQATEDASEAGDYEDDFEDYESDFEELSESTKSESSEASEEELAEKVESDNEKEIKSKPTASIAMTNTRPRTSTIKKHYDETPAVETQITKIQSPVPQNTNQSSGILKKSPSTQVFNFAKAEKELKNHTKLAKAQTRSSQLLDLITLDKQVFGIYDSPPANYEVFIQIFGQSNRKQVYVETEPKDEESIQTDHIEVLDKWTQMPPSGQAAVGGQKLNEKNTFNTETDWLKMSKFLNNATQLICEILDEEANEKLQSQLNRDVTNAPFSQGYLTLKMPSFLTNSSVIEVIFSSNQSNYLLISHDISQTDDTELKGKSIICLWNLKNILNPEYVFVTEGAITKCALNPGLPSLIFSGMSDGSLSMWSLREPASTHLKQKATLNTGEIISYLIPSFSTAVIQSQTSHQSAITSLQTVIYGSSLNEDSQFCHLLSLEEFGILNTWSVVPTNNRDQSGFDLDLEMAPGGRLKLVKTANIDLSQIPGLEINLSKGLRTFAMEAFPHDPNHILFTTDLGLIYHFTRHGGSASPRFYKDEIIVPFKILSLTFNLHYPILFATGSDDGIVRIFKDKMKYPVFKLPSVNRSSISSLAWSSTHPTFLYSTDDSSTLSIWDISSPSLSPVYHHSFENDKLIAFSLHRGLSEETIWSNHMAISLRDKGIIIHKLDDSLSNITEEKYKEQMKFLDDL